MTVSIQRRERTNSDLVYGPDRGRRRLEKISSVQSYDLDLGGISYLKSLSSSSTLKFSMFSRPMIAVVQHVLTGNRDVNKKAVLTDQMDRVKYAFEIRI